MAEASAEPAVAVPRSPHFRSVLELIMRAGHRAGLWTASLGGRPL